MQMIELNNYDIFCNNKSTLKETSLDSSSSEYMTQSEIVVIDFDMVKKEYEKKIGLPYNEDGYACSVDAIFCSDERITFVEFKNGNMKNQKNNVKNKLRDSLLIFGAITNQNISFTRENIDFILVYNGEKNPIPHQEQKKISHELSAITSLGKSISKRGNQKLILFGLEKFEKLYFRQVYTFTQKEFEQYLIKHYKNTN